MCHIKQHFIYKHIIYALCCICSRVDTCNNLCGVRPPRRHIITSREHFSVFIIYIIYCCWGWAVGVIWYQYIYMRIYLGIKLFQSFGPFSPICFFYASSSSGYACIMRKKTRESAFEIVLLWWYGILFLSAIFTKAFSLYICIYVDNAWLKLCCYK